MRLYQLWAFSYVLYSSITALLVWEPAAFMPGFQIGVFHFGHTLDQLDNSSCIQAINECFENNLIGVEMYFEVLKQSQGLSLFDYAHRNVLVPINLDISVQFMRCVAPPTPNEQF